MGDTSKLCFNVFSAKAVLRINENKIHTQKGQFDEGLRTSDVKAQKVFGYFRLPLVSSR